MDEKLQEILEYYGADLDDSGEPDEIPEFELSRVSKKKFREVRNGRGKSKAGTITETEAKIYDFFKGSGIPR